MNEQIVIYAYNGILFSLEKEWSTNKCYSMNEPWKHYAKWKKLVTNDPILYDSIYIWNVQN